MTPKQRRERKAENFPLVGKRPSTTTPQTRKRKDEENAGRKTRSAREIIQRLALYFYSKEHLDSLRPSKEEEEKKGLRRFLSPKKKNIAFPAFDEEKFEQAYPNDREGKEGEVDWTYGREKREGIMPSLLVP